MIDDIIKKAQKLFYEGKDDDAIDLLQPLVDEGNTVAKSNLGLILSHYYRNNEFIKLKEGEKLLNEACEEGESSACHNLGTLWLGNQPAFGKDKKKAAYFYLKAKEIGGPIANKEFYEEMEKILNS
jgi:TPR repeat protein